MTAGEGYVKDWKNEKENQSVSQSARRYIRVNLSAE